MISQLWTFYLIMYMCIFLLWLLVILFVNNHQHWPLTALKTNIKCCHSGRIGPRAMVVKKVQLALQTLDWAVSQSPGRSPGGIFAIWERHFHRDSPSRCRNGNNKFNALGSPALDKHPIHLKESNIPCHFLLQKLWWPAARRDTLSWCRLRVHYLYLGCKYWQACNLID